jgi:2-polyprenyl-6-methoxyphenol hydroxylase-like FAD-dependent oxidoreductase
MTAARDTTTEVAIVGGGPVGLALAIELGQRGISCVLLERYLQPQPIPRGQNLTQRTMEHFQAWHAEKELRAARTVPADYGMGGLTAYGTLLGKYHYDWMKRELVRPYYNAENERLPQYATEAVLRERLAKLPCVTTHFGWKVDAVSQDADGVSVMASARDGDGQMRIAAQYAVGCDGSRSVVREAAGVTQTLADHDLVMVLLVFRSTGLHELLKRYPGKSFYAVLHPRLRGYWQFFGRVDLGTTWFFHAPVPEGTTRDNFDFVQLLHDAAGEDFDVEIEHVGFWDLRFAVADSYRQGRMFIAGDAAHSHPPYGGYGINTGFEDARNLGWKLAARLRGWGGDALLDSYSLERQPVFASTSADFIAKSIEVDRAFLAAFDPNTDLPAFEGEWHARSVGARAEVASFAPHYEGSPAVDGAPGATCSAVGTHEFTARPGHHLSPAALPLGGNIYDRLGAGFTLLAFDAAPETITRFRDAAASLHVPLDVIEGQFTGEPARYGERLVLVRPDHYVAWAASEVSDAHAILAKATGQ